MKKTAVALIVCIFAVFFVSCGSQEKVVNIEYDESFESSIQGLTFRWGSEWNTQLNPTEGFSSAGDKMNARYRELEQTYGCTFEVVNWEDGGGRVLQDIAAGLDTIDLIDTHSDTGGIQLYESGLLACLEDISTIDLSNGKWGTEAFRQYGYFDGKSYGFYQFKWEYMPEFAGVLLFNGNLLSKLGLDYPYELQENGEWNWENFRKILETVQTNADPSNDIVPYTMNGMATDIQAFMFANGCQVVKQNSSGQYEFALNTQSAYSTVEYLNGLFTDKLLTTDGMTKFTDEEAVFVSCESFYGTHHHDGYTYPTNVLSNFGMMPAPYGPDGNASLSSAFVHSHRRLNWVIAYSGNDIDDIGTVIDFIFEPLDEGSDGWRSYSESLIFHHSQDYDNYCYMLDNINYNYSVQIPSLTGSSGLYLGNMVKGIMSISEGMEKIAAKAETEIDENMNN